MSTKQQTDMDVTNANIAVEKSYQAIIKEVKELLKLFPTEELRTYVERDSTKNDSRSFYSPMVYIGMGEYFGKRMISFAKNFKVKPHIGIMLDTIIIRCIYKQTGVDLTQIDIEDRVEEYSYYADKFEDALKHSETLPNYKKHMVALAKQEG